MEQVSGTSVDFEMGSLAPGTRYTVEVQAVKEAQKSDSAVTEFTTGKPHPPTPPAGGRSLGKPAAVLNPCCFLSLRRGSPS